MGRSGQTLIRNGQNWSNIDQKLVKIWSNLDQNSQNSVTTDSKLPKYCQKLIKNWSKINLKL